MVHNVDEIAARIRRVEYGLVPLGARPDATGGGQSLAERMAYYGVPGLSVALIDGDEIAWARGYGVREAGHGARVTPETRFEAGSISKPVAAVAALRLVERGTLDLDADINDRLVSWRVPANEDWQPRVTLRHLLSHTGGLTVHGFPGYPRDADVPNLLQVLDGTKPANTIPVRVDSLPGTQFRYSGGGYCVLQQLLIDVTGMPFPDLMHELVLVPAGMAHSTYAQPLPQSLWDGAAAGHRFDGTTVAGRWHVYPEMAAAGLWTTASDLARFALAMQRSAAGDRDGLLSAAMAAELLAPQLPDPSRPSLHMGLGLFLAGGKAHARFRHGGSDQGFQSELVAYRDRGQGIAVMTNGDRGSQLAAEIVWAAADVYEWPGYREEQPPPVVLDAETLVSYTGSYAVRPGFVFIVSRDEDGLAVRATGQAAFPLVARSETSFITWILDVTFTFVRDAIGTVTGLTFRQQGHETFARRVADH
jgi:CubicO group peptidase (beta-lactamase class C family)